jgi:hypothetical protein
VRNARLSLAALTGRPVRGPEPGRRIGWLRDVAVDLSCAPVRVTRIVVGDLVGRWSLPWTEVSLQPPDAVCALDCTRPRRHRQVPTTPHELMLVRDVLDSRVYDVVGRRSVRVGDVWLDLGADGSLVVAGLEVGPRVFLRRLGLRRERVPPTRLLSLSQVHLTSQNGHRVQLATPSSSVHGLEGADLAHLLTHLPMASAADVVRQLPAPSALEAVEHLHPHLADRLRHALDGGATAVSRRRLRRTAGWRIYNPTHDEDRRSRPPGSRP